ncbi:MAG: hypothetical protein ACU841_13305 [Gammaproteobacteria bacterium]
MGRLVTPNLTGNSKVEYTKKGSIPFFKIVPILASESSFYRILRDAKQLKHRQAGRVAACHKPKAQKAAAPNLLYRWDIAYPSTSVKGVFLYHYLFMDVFSRKIVGW